MKKRIATKIRKTKETEISVKLNIDGKGQTKINTGIGILDHMLELFAFHGLFDLEIAAKGDLKVDLHHTNEDVGIVLGDAFKEALGDKVGIQRNGSAIWPMEEVTANVAVDICGRTTFRLEIQNVSEMPISEEGYQFDYVKHLLESFAKHVGMNLTISLNRTTRDLHTSLEPIFKALGKALDEATKIDPRRKVVPSTKGVID